MTLVANLARICENLVNCDAIHPLVEALRRRLSERCPRCGDRYICSASDEVQPHSSALEVRKNSLSDGEKVEGLPVTEAAKKCIEAVEKLI